MPPEDKIRIRHLVEAASKAVSYAAGRSRDALDVGLPRPETARQILDEPRARDSRVSWAVPGAALIPTASMRSATLIDHDSGGSLSPARIR